MIAAKEYRVEIIKHMFKKGSGLMSSTLPYNPPICNAESTLSSPKKFIVLFMTTLEK